MEDFSIIYKGTLTDQDETLFNNAKGCVIKSILLYNTDGVQTVEVVLTFDEVPFSLELQPNEFKHMDIVMFTKEIIANGKDVNIHISGLQIT